MHHCTDEILRRFKLKVKNRVKYTVECGIIHKVCLLIFYLLNKPGLSLTINHFSSC